MLTISPRLFADFLSIVVEGGAFSDEERARAGGPLPEKVAAQVGKGRLDNRPPYLMTVSGKGGWVEGAAFAARRRFRNVTLLDHVVSVARGAGVFAELDLRAAGVAEEHIAPRVAVVMAVGFLHDADKILGLARSNDLTTAQVEGLVERYRVDAFLAKFGVAIDSDDLLSMIHAVEVSRSGTLRPGMRLLSTAEVGDCLYVRLADRLDAAFLDMERGIEGVVSELASFGGLRSAVLKSGWGAIRLRAPHTPFLLDRLQRAFSVEVERLAGMPPLIEVHHDGELLVVCPKAVAEEASRDAIRRTAGSLGIRMRVMINPKGTRNILDGGGDHQTLLDLLAKQPVETSKALFVQARLLNEGKALRDNLDSLLAPLGFPVNLSGLAKFSGSHFQPWPMRDGNDERLVTIRREAAALAVGLGCEEPEDRDLARRVPGAATREAELIKALDGTGIAVPAWLTAVPHRLSRQTLLAALAAAEGYRNDAVHEALLGDEGLLRLWLCGDGDARAGLLDKIGDPAGALITAAGDWLGAAAGRRFVAADESLPGRCHFTALPVGLDARIDTKSGMPGLNVSAFSGREGRPESFENAKAQTLVSSMAAAEQRLRALSGRARDDGIPAHVSSPTIMGLFGGLTVGHVGDEFLAIDHFDTSRFHAQPDKPIYPETETFARPLAFARHVSIPTSLLSRTKSERSIVGLARMMMQAALRLGRPVHAFRGLPSPEAGFFHLDFLPGAIEQGIGGRSLRIEQVPAAIELLRVVERMHEAANVSLEVALRFADPSTRFAAACEVLAILDRLPEDKQAAVLDLRRPLRSATRSPVVAMSDNENVIFEFARAMTRVQDAPKREASNAVRLLGMKVALEALEACTNEIAQTGGDTVAAAIAGRLGDEFERSSRLDWRGKDRGVKFPRQAALEAGRVFVNRVLPIAFKGRPPASKARRIALAVYQVAFETESYRPRAKSEADLASADTSAT